MIAQLRTRVGIYHPVTTPDDLGGSVTTWPLWDAVWADIKMLSPRQTFDNGRAEVTVQYKVILRYRDGFPEGARLIWGERTLRVIAASDPDLRCERLHLICEEERQ